MAWFEISNEIERRFYEDALSPDLKWRKQGLASLGRCCLMENAISPPNYEVFKPASKSGYPNIWCVDIFKKIWESSSSFLFWLRFMKVGKVEKNFHTFLLSSSLIHHLIGPWKWGFEGFRPWATSKNRLKHLIPILENPIYNFAEYFVGMALMLSIYIHLVAMVFGLYVFLLIKIILQKLHGSKITCSLAIYLTIPYCM